MVLGLGPAHAAGKTPRSNRLGYRLAPCLREGARSPSPHLGPGFTARGPLEVIGPGLTGNVMIGVASTGWLLPAPILPVTRAETIVMLDLAAPQTLFCALLSS